MRAALLVFALACGLIGPAVAEPLSARLYADRSFGFFVGDVARARVEVVAEEGLRLQSASLPLPGPLTYWLDLRDIASSRRARDVGSRVGASSSPIRSSMSRSMFATWKFLASRCALRGAPASRPSARRSGRSASRPCARCCRKGATIRPIICVRTASSPRSTSATPTLWAGALAASTLAALAAVARDRGWPPFHHRRARVFAAAARRLAVIGEARR